MTTFFFALACFWNSFAISSLSFPLFTDVSFCIVPTPANPGPRALSLTGKVSPLRLQALVTVVDVPLLADLCSALAPKPGRSKSKLPCLLFNTLLLVLEKLFLDVGSSRGSFSFPFKLECRDTAAI